MASMEPVFPGSSPKDGIAMITCQINDSSLQSLLIEARQTGSLLAAAMDQNHRLIATLGSTVECPSNVALNSASTRPDAFADHRRNHRGGTLSRITCDPEIEAFIRARLDTTTLVAIVAQIAAAFPPERHISLSSLSRWWIKSAKPQVAKSAIIRHS